MTARPLYARILRLRHLTPGGLLCFVYFEGALGLGVLLALAELVTWWGVLVLPASVAVMVKLNDLVAAVGSRSTRHPSRTSAGAAVRRSLAERRRTAAATTSPQHPSTAGLPAAETWSAAGLLAAETTSTAGLPAGDTSAAGRSSAGRLPAETSGPAFAGAIAGDRPAAGAESVSRPAATAGVAGDHDAGEVYGLALARGAADVRGAAGAHDLTGVQALVAAQALTGDGLPGVSGLAGVPGMTGARGMAGVRGDAAPSARTPDGVRARGGAVPRFAGQRADARPAAEQAAPTSRAARQGTVYGARHNQDEITGATAHPGPAATGGPEDGRGWTADPAAGACGPVRRRPVDYAAGGPRVGSSGADDLWSAVSVAGGPEAGGPGADDLWGAGSVAGGAEAGGPGADGSWGGGSAAGGRDVGRSWAADSVDGGVARFADPPAAGGDAGSGRPPRTGWQANPIRQSSRRGESAGQDEWGGAGEVDRYRGDPRRGRIRPGDADQRAELDWLGAGRPGNSGRHGEPDRQGHQVRQNEPDWQHESHRHHESHRQNGSHRQGDAARRGDGDEPANLGRRAGVPSGRRSNESYRLPAGGPVQSGGGGPRAGGSPAARGSADGGTHRFPDRFSPRPGEPGDRQAPAADRQPPPAAGHGRRSAGANGLTDGDLRTGQRSDRGRHADTPHQRARRSADRRYE
ncbi:hypothetical protein JCM9533A_37880 [Catenuloplanes niger JCM 9533]|uniref:Uncharacterized protein n=1 Tax=Catenuloplanes niger TaxID=587534 RepID=A0AAE3ZPR4_9ACTN|nr:hypothetical protein [Catenuloplanes niger]